MKKRILIPFTLVVVAILVGGFWFARRSPEIKAAPLPVHEIKTMYHCAMHPQYISDKPGNCPICGMKLVPIGSNPENAESTNGQSVHIDPATIQNMGVKTEKITKHNLQTEIRTSGTVKVDESRLTLINARVTGYVEKLAVNVTGQKVAKGQTLLELYSPDLVSTQEEYLQAIRYAKDGNGMETGAQELVESARRRLSNWGIGQSEIQTLEKSGKAKSTLAIVSPASGVVLEKKVLQGQNVAPGMELYQIADLSKVWVVAALYQRDLATAKLGGEADIELNYLPEKLFHGRITFIAPILDEETKTAEVRIEVDNTPTLDLKPGMFATVHLRSPVGPSVLAVPEQAIIRSGRRNIAVVALGNGLFEPREVQLGATTNEYVEIFSGVKEGETLVVSSQFLIDSESNLRAAVQQLQK